LAVLFERRSEANYMNRFLSPLSRRAVLGLTAGAGAFGFSGRGFSKDAALDRPLRVAAVYSAPAEQPWVSRVHAALNSARERAVITYHWAESVRPKSMLGRIKGFADEGADLIVGEAFSAEREIRLAAAELPKTQFLMASAFQPSLPNF
jgi:basic membrane protein A and related proteins